MENTNKAAAIEFMKLVVDGKFEAAYEQYVDMSGKHHNIYFPAGFPVLKQAMIDDYKQNPNKKLSIKNAIAEGNMVAIHSHLEIAQDNPGISVVHLFRFESGKIVEMWDCIMPLQHDSPNSDGAF